MSISNSSQQRANPVPLTPDVRWIGGVVRPRGLLHAGKPMRVAAWITCAGDVVAAAIVEGHGPSVLRDLLTESLQHAQPRHRPRRVVVWPSARAAFSAMDYPRVTVQRDEFLSVVIEDQVDFGFIPRTLRVRHGQQRSRRGQPLDNALEPAAKPK